MPSALVSLLGVQVPGQRHCLMLIRHTEQRSDSADMIAKPMRGHWIVRPMHTRKWEFWKGKSHVFSGWSSHSIVLQGSSLRPSTFHHFDSSAITVCILTCKLAITNTTAINLLASLRDDLRIPESFEVTPYPESIVPLPLPLQSLAQHLSPPS